MPTEKFWRYETHSGIIYHRGNMWRGSGKDEETTKEEYVQHLLKRVEEVKSTDWTHKAKRDVIAQIVEELKELGVEVKE